MADSGNQNGRRKLWPLNLAIS